jgi:hypothetical protein
MAMGLSEQDLRLHMNLSIPKAFENNLPA